MFYLNSSGFYKSNFCSKLSISFSSVINFFRSLMRSRDLPFKFYWNWCKISNFFLIFSLSVMILTRLSYILLSIIKNFFTNYKTFIVVENAISCFESNWSRYFSIFLKASLNLSLMRFCFVKNIIILHSIFIKFFYCTLF